jgi:hypothetical protein
MAAGLAPGGRRTLAFAVAASLAVSALGPPSPARADGPADPAARLQIVINTIHIIEDTDLIGSGEMKLSTGLTGPAAPDAPGTAGFKFIYDHAFSAGSGDDVTLDRVMPQDSDAPGPGVTPEAGVPVYPGLHYDLRFSMYDRDAFDIDNDDMGAIVAHVDEDHGWEIGIHTVRSLHDDGSPGDYMLTFEVRRTPLPDLWVKSVYVQPSPGGAPGTSWICADVWNAGQRPAPPSTLTARSEGKVLDTFTLPDLEVNWSYPHCISRSALPAQKHNLVFSVDDARQVPEMEEYNNVGIITLEADPTGTASTTSTTAPGSGAPVAAPSPEPQPNPQPVGDQADPSKEQADLTVRAIKVNGQAPDGKDDCKDGKNDVTVVVKNAGKGDADGFTVRLSVDGDDRDATVDGLNAGQEREVRFDDVQLKKGEHTLKAVADPDHAIDEAKDDNNELKATARCNVAG